MLFTGDSRRNECAVYVRLPVPQGGFSGAFLNNRSLWESLCYRLSFESLFYFISLAVMIKFKSWERPVPKRWSLAHSGRMTHFPGPQDCRRSKVVLPLLLWLVPGKVLDHSWSSDQLTPEQKKKGRKRKKKELYISLNVSFYHCTFTSFNISFTILNDNLPLGSSCVGSCLGCLRPSCRSLWLGWLAVKTLSFLDKLKGRNENI